MFITSLMKVFGKKTNGIVVWVFFLSWTSIWAFYLAHDFNRHKHDFVKLAGRSSSEKWSHVFGKDLYDFLEKAKENIPEYERITFHHKLPLYFSGRIRYYLYPRFPDRENGRYVLNYMTDGFTYYIIRKN